MAHTLTGTGVPSLLRVSLTVELKPAPLTAAALVPGLADAVGGGAPPYELLLFLAPWKEFCEPRPPGKEGPCLQMGKIGAGGRFEA